MTGDPEIEAMSAVATALVSLEEEARARVIRWAAERYGSVLDSRGGGRRGNNVGESVGEHDHANDETQVTGAEPPTFEHFAELYNAAGPKDKEETLLVAGYWHQEVEGQPSFQAQELNQNLKNLGHQVSHISEALAASIEKRPAPILQLRKSGSSQQARKTYKLSAVGVETVERMLRRDR